MEEARQVLDAKIEAREAEIGTPLKVDLSPEELAQLADAKEQITALTAQEQQVCIGPITVGC